MDEMIEAMTQAVLGGNRIEIRGFVSWTVKEMEAKPSARNPRTGEIVYVPARRRVSFKPGKILKKPLSRPTDPSLGAASILVIDDEEVVRTAIRTMLEMAGYEVEEAHEGGEGIEKYRQKVGLMSLLWISFCQGGVDWM